MCDYSLELYASRPAREQEEYVTARFSSGSMGVIAAGDPSTAICLQCDTPLRLSNIGPDIQKWLGIGESTPAHFVQTSHGGYRDGVCLPNGRTVSLQQLGTGVKVSVVGLLEHAASFKPSLKPQRETAHAG
ncbi:hypothetical protein PY365_01755 [Roseiarcaceae bacterium H3SJ34-1]|uniref:hypothetical protein n=1 Tax=Terripilifer ovatus TaxID=3032367 RepID=UPI003AB9A8A7|nr:hypothetical protein [Roseiarcaceae bacterium H3SJ34-1]